MYFNYFRTLCRFTNQPKIAFISQEQFLGESVYLLHKIEQSFTKLKEFDTRIQVNSEPLQLNVTVTQIGQYNFNINVKERRIYLQTPSNVYQYYFDEKSEQWCNIKDQHYLIENLTRETSKYLKGYLEF